MTRLSVLVAILVCGLPVCAHSQENASLGLRQEQTRRIRQLVRSVQDQATLLQARLEQRQRDLTEVYNHYQLDEERAHALQAEIVELQRALLANHHRMQIELRSIVDQKRFDVLRQRLRFLVAPPAPADAQPPTEAQPPVPEEQKK